MLICQGRALLALLSQRLTAVTFALTFVTWSEKSFVFVFGVKRKAKLNFAWTCHTVLSKMIAFAKTMDLFYVVLLSLHQLTITVKRLKLVSDQD